MIRKGSYNIRCTDGLKSVDGYIYTTTVQGDLMSFGITQYNDGWYIISEFLSGVKIPIETNVNLLQAIIPLKLFLREKGDVVKVCVNKAVKKYGKANEVRE